MTPEQLKSWRLSRGLTQFDAATLLGVKERYYQYAEAGCTSAGKVIAVIPPRIELAIIKADRAEAG